MKVTLNCLIKGVVFILFFQLVLKLLKSHEDTVIATIKLLPNRENLYLLSFGKLHLN